MIYCQEKNNIIQLIRAMAYYRDNASHDILKFFGLTLCNPKCELNYITL